MLNFTTLRARAQIELDHFSQLSQLTRRFLLTTLVYDLAYPLLYVFINAFILRQTDGFIPVTLYNLGGFLTLPLAFYFNGWLLRYVSLQRLFALGLVGQALVVVGVFFLQVDGLTELFLFGALQGLPMSLYWANRNYVSQTITHDKIRNYYSGLEILISTLTGIITPFCLGLLIRSGEATGWYSPEQAYQSLSFIATLMLGSAGYYFMFTDINYAVPSRLFLIKASSTWWRGRLLKTAEGVNTGLNFFVPALVTLTLLGSEGVLGLIQSIAAVVTTLLMYVFARKAQPSHRTQLLGLAVASYIGVVTLFAGWPNQITVLIYLLLASFFHQVIFVTSNPIMMRTIDDEDEGDSTNNYVYIADQELFLNIGRVMGVGVFLVITRYISQTQTLTIIPLIMASSQVLVWMAAKWLQRHHA